MRVRGKRIASLCLFNFHVLKTPLTIPFGETGLSDISLVGGKNASLGEMIRHLSATGINVPGGFAVTSDAYWKLIAEYNIRKNIDEAL